MGRIKEQLEQTYLFENNDGRLEQPTFFGLIEIIRNRINSADRLLFNDRLQDLIQEEFNPNQLQFFNAEAI